MSTTCLILHVVLVHKYTRQGHIQKFISGRVHRELFESNFKKIIASKKISGFRGF